LYIENDASDKKIFDNFESKFLSKLSGERHEIIDIRRGKINEQKLRQLGLTREHFNKIKNEREFYTKINEKEYLGIYYTQKGENFVVIVSAVNQFGNEQLSNVLVSLVILYLVLLLIVVLIGIQFSKSALDPISNINNTVNKITATNLDQRLEYPANKDELWALSNTFNNLLKRLEDAFMMQRTFVSNASHELRTPLTHLIGQIEVTLQKERSNAELEQILKQTLNSSREMNNLVSDLLLFAKTNIYEESNFKEIIRADELLFDVVGEYLAINKSAQINIDLLNLPEDIDECIIAGNKGLLSIALKNLIDNGLKYSTNKRLDCTLVCKDYFISFVIKDYGVGIPQEELNQIFQPFYRSKLTMTKEGHGIGLALVDKIIKAHSGEITVSSELGQGSEFTLTFNLLKS
jgi:signal transduction histidine kinase